LAVPSETAPDLPLSARETDAFDTAASRATSFIVTFDDLRPARAMPSLRAETGF
jgi:hypothetical protein